MRSQPPPNVSRVRLRVSRSSRAAPRARAKRISPTARSRSRRRSRRRRRASSCPERRGRSRRIRRRRAEPRRGGGRPLAALVALAVDDVGRTGARRGPSKRHGQRRLGHAVAREQRLGRGRPARTSRRSRAACRVDRLGAAAERRASCERSQRAICSRPGALRGERVGEVRGERRSCRGAACIASSQSVGRLQEATACGMNDRRRCVRRAGRSTKPIRPMSW